VGKGHEHGHAAVAEPGGLAVAADGFRLEAPQTTLPAGLPSTFRFAVHGHHGPERQFDEHGGVQLHLIVVRRDLTGYVHLHPEPSPDGAWTTELSLPAAGVYRAYVDFERDGRQTVLGVDLFVAGEFEPQELPETTAVAEADGYRVELSGDAEAQEHGTLAYELTLKGEPIAPEPYLGAGGHLVALRQGDLAYLHAHPLAERPGRLEFGVTFPTAGRYRLFLQFQHEGRVRTVAHTLSVEGSGRGPGEGSLARS
jgi:hypothetical protein